MKKILLVEDTVALANNISDILVMEGYDIRVAHNGLEGIKLVKEFLPSLIITDLVMAEMDGVEMIRQIRRWEEHTDLNRIPIIILSAKVTDDPAEQNKLTGADLFLQKPCSVDNLIDSIASLLPDETT